MTRKQLLSQLLISHIHKKTMISLCQSTTHSSVEFFGKLAHQLISISYQCDSTCLTNTITRELSDRVSKVVVQLHDCFQGDSPQPTVALRPSPCSSTTHRKLEKGWSGALQGKAEITGLKMYFFAIIIVRCSYLLVTGTRREKQYTQCSTCNPFNLCRAFFTGIVSL